VHVHGINATEVTKDPLHRTQSQPASRCVYGESQKDMISVSN